VVFEQSFVVLSEKVEPTKFEHERARPDEERDEDQKPNKFLRAHAGLHDAAQHHERHRRDRDADETLLHPRRRDHVPEAGHGVPGDEREVLQEYVGGGAHERETR
jgi:hypothetical protein